MKVTLKSRYAAASLGVIVAFGLAGATATADDKAADAPKAPPQFSQPLWSWQPVKAPDVPKVAQKSWVRQPIDAFILAKLEAQKLKPSPDADRATFIRRATLDAWGLIPTPEEVSAFVNDKSPNAYEKLVDRLLSSPKYGERQTRHWLDLARYADTTGFQIDEGRPNIWRYRDYVINAFNDDKPYDLFLKEQIAGDELEPGNEQALIATGFMANYPDNSNSRDLVQRKYQITTDIVDTIGQGILATTWNCARCHNSKFDKLTQKDYYSIQAFFANARRRPVEVAVGVITGFSLVMASGNAGWTSSSGRSWLPPNSMWVAGASVCPSSVTPVSVLDPFGLMLSKVRSSLVSLRYSSHLFQSASL